MRLRLPAVALALAVALDVAFRLTVAVGLAVAPLAPTAEVGGSFEPRGMPAATPLARPDILSGL